MNYNDIVVEVQL